MAFPTLGAIRSLPSPYDTERATVRRERWLAAAGDGISHELNADATGSALLDAVFGNSPFLARSLARSPGVAGRWAALGPEACLAEARVKLVGPSSERDLMARLRDARTETAIAVALSDIAGLWTWRESTAALSDFAEAACRAALDHALRQAAAAGRLGGLDPDDPQAAAGLIVLGLGKLGGGELNFSSDIDLIVLWDGERFPVADGDGARSLCIRLTRRFIRLLEERTSDGHVLRTDLRLRPDPSATPLAISVDAAELYYESLGQNWERAALIKARPVAGDIAAGEAFLHRLRPFVWRRHLDFAAIRDIHSIKRQIHAHKGGGEIAAPGHNVKLGRGGIREIEFFAQTQQLIFGGREPDLRRRATCDALRALARAGRIDDATASELEDAYGELRRVEHRLQMVDDAQTHTLPSTTDGLDRIAAFLGYRDRERMIAALLALFRRVEARYADLFENAPPLSGAGLGAAGNLVFTGAENDPDTLDTLTRMGFSDAASVAGLIRGWHHGRVRATRGARAREILTELMPRLLSAFAATTHPDVALMRFHEFLDRLPAGVQLFSLFHGENDLLDLVAEIMGTAPRLAEHLAHAPILLDHVLSRDFFDVLPKTNELETDLSSSLDRTDHEEGVLDELRRWSHDREFQLGAQLLRGFIGADRASRGLTDLTDAVLRQAIPRVARAFAKRHGTVSGGDVAIVAFGKFGARELNFGSDLDAVFVYAHDEGADVSDGARPLAASQYFIRLSQRIVTALTSHTNAGRLFDIDMRLRPSGAAGPLACDVERFVRYQRDDAWQWEHLALTKARVVTGGPALANRLRRAIGDVLTRPRDPVRLADAVVDMRRRIAREHPPSDRFDVKYVEGGLIDLDFLAQYLQLVHAGSRPGVLSRRAEPALGALAEAGLLSAVDAAALAEAGRLMRDVQTAIRLAMARPTAEDDLTPPLRDLIVRVSGADGFETLCGRLDAARMLVKSAFERTVAARATGEENGGRG